MRSVRTVRESQDEERRRRDKIWEEHQPILDSLPRAAPRIRSL